MKSRSWINWGVKWLLRIRGAVHRFLLIIQKRLLMRYIHISEARPPAYHKGIDIDILRGITSIRTHQYDHNSRNNISSQMRCKTMWDTTKWGNFEGRANPRQVWLNRISLGFPDSSSRMIANWGFCSSTPNGLTCLNFWTRPEFAGCGCLLLLSLWVDTIYLEIEQCHNKKRSNQLGCICTLENFGKIDFLLLFLKGRNTLHKNGRGECKHIPNLRLILCVPFGTYVTECVYDEEWAISGYILIF